MNEVVAVIPARMGSSRFPGKPLAKILGKPMIQHVWERTRRSPGVDEVYIATCDHEIRETAERFGARVVMTSHAHTRASERVAEAATGLTAEIVVMIQGDEPLIEPGMIDEALAPFADGEVVCSNLLGRIEDAEEFLSPNTIKVVVDGRFDAVYMSRQPIPTGPRDRVPEAAGKQICIIPFRREVLARFAALPETPLERAESIDMLRFIEHGIKVRMVPTAHRVQSVDTPGDLARVESILRGEA